MFDQRRGMPRVPLQGTFQAWVAEVGQGMVDARTELAQLSHQPWFKALEAGQRLAFYVLKQACAQGLAIQAQCQQVLAGTRWHHARHRQPALTQVTEGGMLGLKLDRRIITVADLQHVTTLRAVEAKIQVLLTAQRL